MSLEPQTLPQDQESKVPAIRIVPHIEGSRSLQFDILEKEVPENVIVKIGRFTDKAHAPNRIAFKSKVVSRGHAEIWCSKGKFYIKDTKSSSGTFLNHSRLSPPNSESREFQLNDGDVVQLGVDYQGGTEEIYRCVKMRVELNYSWKRPINQFSLNSLKQFKQITQMGTSEGTKQQVTDCCICLSGIGPCQALFLAPCSHVFHYKCIRPILFSHHSGFLCPLCRSFADLEAPIDNNVDWEQILAEQEVAGKLQGGGGEEEEEEGNVQHSDNGNSSPAENEEQRAENNEEPSTNNKDIQAIGKQPSTTPVIGSPSNLGPSSKGTIATSSSSFPPSIVTAKTPIISPTILTNIDANEDTSSSLPSTPS